MRNSTSSLPTIRYPHQTTSSITAVRIRGQAFELGGDTYFALLTRPLWQFCLAIVLLVVFLNIVFALIYLIDPGGISNARPGSLEDAFFFSVQTLATIGYGTMAPMTRFTHVVVTIESITGILSVGSLAGIAFARLSRPKARVLFTEKAVIRPRNGVPHLQFRMANWRTNLIVEANVRVFLLVSEMTTEGEMTRTPLEVRLVRSSTPFFFLTFTAMHRIDETSPFFGPDAIGKLRAARAQLYVNLSGYDQTLGQTVHAYREYPLDNIVQNARFVDVISLTPDGVRELDFSRFHDLEPVEVLPPKQTLVS